MSFRGKILLSVALPAVALVSLIALAAYLYVSRQAGERADADVVNTRARFDRQLKRRLADINKACRPFGFGRFKANFELMTDGGMSAEDFARALADFDGALSYSPGDVWARVGRALCLEKIGRPEEAARELSALRGSYPGLFSNAPTPS